MAWFTMPLHARLVDEWLLRGIILAHIPLPRAQRSALRELTAFVQMVGLFIHLTVRVLGVMRSHCLLFVPSHRATPPTLTLTHISVSHKFALSRGDWLLLLDGASCRQCCQGNSGRSRCGLEMRDMTFLCQNSALCLKFDAPTSALMLCVVCSSTIFIEVLHIYSSGLFDICSLAVSVETDVLFTHRETVLFVPYVWLLYRSAG